MDVLELKSSNILQRLRQLQGARCCLHIDEQIRLWYQNLSIEPSPQLQLTTTTTATDTTPLPPQLPPTTTTPPPSTATTTTTTPPPPLSPTTTPPPPPPQPPPPTATPPATTNTTPKSVPTASSTTIGCLLSNIKHLEALDSDATESTSSDDSYDELEGFSLEEIPPKKINSTKPSQPKPKNQAILKWAHERSRLAARWTWLQAQISDLEFRIRGQNDALMHCRAFKAPVLHLVPNSQCSRTVPINKDFRRRRLIKSSKILSDSNKKLVKFSHVPCVCSSLPQTVAPCLSCNGRYNYLRQTDGDNAPVSERISLLDPCCHPVLSFPDDLTLGSQLSYLLKQETINRKPTKGRPGRKKGSTAANLAAAAAAAAAAANNETNGTVKNKGKYYRGMVGRPPGSSSQSMITSNKLRRKYRKHTNNWVGPTKRNKPMRRASSINEGSESSNQCRPKRRRSEQSAYDIDNIVIPFSIAATTRVEVLEYKEIMTPSWRVWENGATTQQETVDSEANVDEDTSDEAYILRHSKGERDEKKRFSLKPIPVPPIRGES